MAQMRLIHCTLVVKNSHIEKVLLSLQREFYNVILTLFDLCAQEYCTYSILTLLFKRKGSNASDHAKLPTFLHKS